MRILVCGGCGYVGGWLTDSLRKMHDVTVYDNLTYENRYLKEVKFVYGDVCDREKLLPLLKNTDVVIWLAAIVGDGACALNPETTKEVNELSVRWLTEEYKGKIIFTSTCSVYGAKDELIDEMGTTNPLSLYAQTKLNAEKFIQERNDDFVIFRLGTLFGKGDNYSRIRLDLVANVLTKQATLGEKLRVFGGEQWRPLLHVRDVASAVDFALANDISGLYNLSYKNYRIKDIANTISLNIKNTVIEYADMPYEDRRNYRVSSEKFKNLGWHPGYSLEQGIEQMREIISQGRICNVNDPVYSNQAFLTSIKSEKCK